MNHMKHIYTTIAASFLLCAGLVSCEMKKELFGNADIPTETGLVELGVDVDDKTNVVVTKAEATEGDEEQGSSVDPADFPVCFTLKTNESYSQEFIYSDIKGETVELPIGTYEVVSHTPGEMAKQMSAPYYKGSSELTVAKELTQKAKITCTMQNTRILVVYPEDFIAAFSEWTITIDDGTENTLTFVYNSENKDLNPAAVYWAIAENCSSLSISIKAKTISGATVSETRSITKPTGASDTNWVGGDALTITMKPIENNAGGVSGITIDVSAFFETEKDEVVEVPIEDEDNTETPTDPDEGEDGDTTDGPTITMPNNGLIEYTQGSIPTDPANIEILAPAKFKSVVVQIKGGNTAFASTIAALSIQLDTGRDIMTLSAGDETESFVIGLLGGVPTTDDTDYQLNMAQFIGMMDGFGPTSVNDDIDGNDLDAHEFIVTVTDQNDETVTKTLQVKINPKATE